MSKESKNPPILELRDICKSFDGVSALHHIDFRLHPGEVVALLGDNGAGKSTLVKVISGVLQADSGEIRIKGRSIDIHRFTVKAARSLGIETVHQERSLGEKQPLWRNIFMGRHLINRLGFIDVRRERAETLDILNGRLGLRGVGIDADAEVSVLSGGERQGLAIGRAMHFQADIVILDEPTTALSLKEVGKVLDFIGQIRAEGKACLFISHNIGHAYMASDRFFLMDRGVHVGEYSKADLTQDGLLHALVEAAT
ncbi:MAG: sugar ABC transporter ATP-binding protein [Deltaproteobacteria bacterium]|nr:sugar ABC transporter ATP-binding protein [Deltaproteobacteria bacterium]